MGGFATVALLVQLIDCRQNVEVRSGLAIYVHVGLHVCLYTSVGGENY